MECGRGRGGARPGYGGGARERGNWDNWKSARDIILVPTSDVVIRLAQQIHSVIALLFSLPRASLSSLSSPPRPLVSITTSSDATSRTF
jgi:hypothetical protein